jgi:tetratricopeptide (TPR) repeat protein
MIAGALAPRRLFAVALIAGVLATAPACRRGGTGGGEGGEDEPAAVGRARALLDQGQPDAALAELQAAGENPEALYFAGTVWMRKAETAALPTPLPPPSPLPKNWEPPPAAEFKDEEVRAADALARAIAVRPNHARAHLALAELLAPHAARAHDREQEAAAQKKKPGARPSAPPAPPPVDASTDRVIRSYMAALQNDGPPAAIEGIIRFGRRVGRVDAAEAGLKELIRRAREAEAAEPLVRYGDFLLADKKEPGAAVEQYRQALIWRPEDEALRNKLADIYIDLGKGYYASRQWSLADTNFKEAARWVTDRSSERSRTIEDYQRRLISLRTGR